MEQDLFDVYLLNMVRDLPKTSGEIYSSLENWAGYRAGNSPEIYNENFDSQMLLRLFRYGVEQGKFKVLVIQIPAALGKGTFETEVVLPLDTVSWKMYESASDFEQADEDAENERFWKGDLKEPEVTMRYDNNWLSKLHPLVQDYLKLPNGAHRMPNSEEWSQDYGLGYIDRCLKEGKKCVMHDGKEVDPQELLKK